MCCFEKAFSVLSMEVAQGIVGFVAIAGEKTVAKSYHWLLCAGKNNFLRIYTCANYINIIATDWF